MIEIQNQLLEYIENGDIELDYENLQEFINDQNIFDDPQELKAVLHLIVKISNNHHHIHEFYNKIDHILMIFSKPIMNFFSNFERFCIFQSNKRILLFLFENKIITPDNAILNCIINGKNMNRNYHYYFFPEFSSSFENLKNSKNFKFDEISQFYLQNKDLFEEKRQRGENDNYICTLIQNESIEEFIQYFNQANLSKSSLIKPSIFETNTYLIKHQPNLMEYAAFYGSMQVLAYLYYTNAELQPSLWIYAVHGNNPEMIHYLEDKKINIEAQYYNEIFLESIKCHHNDIGCYLQTNFLNEENNTGYLTCFKSYNYYFMPDAINDDFESFYYLCKYDYISLVKLFLEKDTIKKEINAEYIFNSRVFIKLSLFSIIFVFFMEFHNICFLIAFFIFIF